jgi:hypothetical protein
MLCNQTKEVDVKVINGYPEIFLWLSIVSPCQDNTLQQAINILFQALTYSHHDNP